MVKLNVKLPDVIIRVSEVIPQIIAYIQKIIDNGFAYVTADNSVYFDTEQYIKQGYHFDGILEEEIELLQKKNSKDFALWKGRLAEDVGFDAKFVYNEKIIAAWGDQAGISNVRR